MSGAPPRAAGRDRDTARLEHEAVLAAGEHLLQQLTLRDADPGGADLAMTLDVDPRLTNPRGGLQGGLVATLADIAAGRALLAVIPTGHHLATADLNIHYLRSVSVGPARAEATVVRLGRTLAVVRVDVTDAGTGELAAICNLAFSVLAPRDDAGPTDPDPRPSAEDTNPGDDHAR